VAVGGQGRIIDAGSFPTQAEGGSTVVEEALAPMKRQGPKLGRNDPCPLDPTKKFKNCCGATGSKGCLKVGG